MRIWHANLGRGVSTSAFTTNLRVILDAGGPRAVFAFQEIDEADAPEEMDILWSLTRTTHRIVGENTAVPILVPRHLAVVESTQTPACKGLAKYTPNRIVNEALVSVGPNLDVAILNTHLPLNRPATLTRRRDVRQALRKRARARMDVAGVWIADTNTHHGWPRIAPNEQTVTDAGIDKAKSWGGPGRKVVVTDQRTVPLSIDGHDAHGARIRWVRS